MMLLIKIEDTIFCNFSFRLGFQEEASAGAGVAAWQTSPVRDQESLKNALDAPSINRCTSTQLHGVQ